ncbi:hypothetical protein HYY72_01065 [Candidatus Woesearchaeota archaeon]|nr:hypothetical protein [Candidatus Woesearchaeota archaeon]
MKNSEDMFLYGCLAVAVAALLVTGYTLFAPINSGLNVKSVNGEPDKHFQAAVFSDFDRKKASEFMDSNNDGICDFCGMRVEDCIASGMMQCTMAPTSEIGLLGSQHAHSDIKVYMNGSLLDLSDARYFVRSKFVHVENDGPGKSGNLVHVHAKGINVGFFLESLGIGNKDFKVYVNGVLQQEGLNYKFNNKDRILVTASEDKTEIAKQIDSLTGFTGTK